MDYRSSKNSRAANYKRIPIPLLAEHLGLLRGDAPRALRRAILARRRKQTLGSTRNMTSSNPPSSRRLVGLALLTISWGMVCFAYNCGVANLKSSTLLRKHKAGDYAGAAKEFARWNKAAGKVMAGLTRRRAAEAALYLR